MLAVGLILTEPPPDLLRPPQVDAEANVSAGGGGKPATSQDRPQGPGGAPPLGMPGEDTAAAAAMTGALGPTGFGERRLVRPGVYAADPPPVPTGGEPWWRAAQLRGG